MRAVRVLLTPGFQTSNHEGGKTSMRNYTTQMDAARKGILTPELEIVAKKENMTTEALMKLVAEGKVAICANKNHVGLNPEGVGSMLRTLSLIHISEPTRP